MLVRREEPCANCPFKKGVPCEAQEPDSSQLLPFPNAHISTMLCHDSGCLDGLGPDDYVCEGARRSCEAYKTPNPE